MIFENLLASKKAIVLGLDDVLYPKKDYLLQVYYLFSEFMAYSEQMNAKAIVDFMQQAYLTQGSSQIFEKTAAAFDIPLTYQKNFKLLHQNARLPLKLLLFQQVLSFLQEAVKEGKKIFVLADGDPIQQLNKIKQIEWHGLEQYLTLYFTSEFEAKPSEKSVIFILENNKLNQEQVLLIGKGKVDEDFAKNAGINFLSVEEIL